MTISHNTGERLRREKKPIINKIPAKFIAKIIEEVKNSQRVGVLLFNRELMRTYKKSRIGIFVVALPALAGTFVTLTLSTSSTNGNESTATNILTMLLWLFLVDAGSFPIRIYKRVRPLVLTLRPGPIEMLIASLTRAIFLGSIRSAPIIIPIMAQQLIKRNETIDLPEMGEAVINSLLLISVELLAVFAIGYLIASFYTNFMEINKFLPPSLMILGYLSGYYPVNRPELIKGLDAINPFSMLRLELQETWIPGTIKYNEPKLILIAAVSIVSIWICNQGYKSAKTLIMMN